MRAVVPMSVDMPKHPVGRTTTSRSSTYVETPGESSLPLRHASTTARCSYSTSSKPQHNPFMTSIARYPPSFAPISRTRAPFPEITGLLLVLRRTPSLASALGFRLPLVHAGRNVSSSTTSTAAHRIAFFFFLPAVTRDSDHAVRPPDVHDLHALRRAAQARDVLGVTRGATTPSCEMSIGTRAAETTFIPARRLLLVGTWMVATPMPPRFCNG